MKRSGKPCRKDSGIARMLKRRQKNADSFSLKMTLVHLQISDPRLRKVLTYFKLARACSQEARQRKRSVTRSLRLLLLAGQKQDALHGLDMTGWSPAAIAQVQKVQKAEAARKVKEEELRKLQLKPSSSGKRQGDTIDPEVLEKRVSFNLLTFLLCVLSEILLTPLVKFYLQFCGIDVNIAKLRALDVGGGRRSIGFCRRCRNSRLPVG